MNKRRDAEFFKTGAGCLIIVAVLLFGIFFWLFSGPLLAYFVYRDGWEETNVWKRIFGILASISVIGVMAYYFINPAMAQGPVEPLQSRAFDAIAIVVQIASLSFIYKQAIE